MMKFTIKKGYCYYHRTNGGAKSMAERYSYSDFTWLEQLFAYSGKDYFSKTPFDSFGFRIQMVRQSLYIWTPQDLERNNYFSLGNWFSESFYAIRYDAGI